MRARIAEHPRDSLNPNPLAPENFKTFSANVSQPGEIIAAKAEAAAFESQHRRYMHKNDVGTIEEVKRVMSKSEMNRGLRLFSGTAHEPLENDSMYWHILPLNW